MRKVGVTLRASLGLFCILTLIYAVSPYVALLRLAQAIREGDAGALEGLIAWDSVREGIKEDICDMVFDAPVGDATVSTALPPFGASFMAGIAASAIDDMVTPDHLAAFARPASMRPALPAGGRDIEHGPVAIDHAFFDSPTSFSIVVRPDSGSTTIRLQLDLRHGEWRVTRAWLPASLLEGNAHT